MISNITLIILLFLAALGAGSGALVFKNWAKKKIYAQKHYSYKRISAIVTPEFHDQVKAHATLLDLTITDYILIAINEKIERVNNGK